MTKLLHLLFALTGYVCTATIISLALGILYLWHTDRLNDEKMFRIVALLHDVDLAQIAAAQHKTSAEVPPEEPSLAGVMHQQQVLDRNYEIKQLALQRGRMEYDHRLQQLKEQTDRSDRMAQNLQNKLKEQEELTTQENLAKVVNNIEQLKPDEAKELLMRYIEESRMDDVILLMDRMSESKRRKILLTFATPPELDELYKMLRRMQDGATPQLEQAVGAAVDEAEAAAAPQTGP
jgi:hypothetical protein